MATTLDRLKFIISADASSAITAFESIAREADQNFAMAADRIDKVANKLVGFGAGALAASGLVGRQFYSMTVGASDLNETVNKTRVVFGDAYDEIDAFAKQAAKSLGTSRRGALDAASSIGMFGKAAGKSGSDLAGFTTDLVQLSADLASFFNTSIPDAQRALSAALRGEMEPIRRYNVLLNDAALKSRAMAMGIYDGKGALTGQQKILAAYQEILAQTSDAQGDFARTSDGFANSQRTLQANIQDLKDSIGEAFLPILQTTTGALAGGVRELNSLNTATGGVISKMALFGTAATAVVGGLALVAGLALKMKTTLTDAEGELTKLGSTAKAAAIGLAALGVIETIGMAVYELGGFAQQTETRLNRLLAVTGNADTTQEITTAFAELADQLKNADTSVTAFFKQFGKAIRVAGADTDAGRIAIEYLDEAFSQIAARSPKQAQQIINALAAQAQQLDKNKATYQDNMMLVGRYQEQLNALVEAEKAVTAATTENTDATEEDARAKLEAERRARELEQRLKSLRSTIQSGITDAQKSANAVLAEARQRFNDYASSVADSIRVTFSFATALNAVKAAQAASAAATDKVAGAQTALANATEDKATADEAVADAQRDLFRAQRDGSSIDEITSAQERLTEALKRQTAAVDAVTAANTALTAAQTAESSAQAEAGKSFLDRLQAEAETATGFADRVQTLIRMGLSQDALQQVLSAGATAGSTIADEIISGGQDAIARTNALTQSVKDAATRAGTDGAAAFYQAGVSNAEQLVKGVDSVLKKYKLKLKSKNLSESQLKRLKKQFAVDVDFEFVTREYEVPNAAKGGIVRARPGGQIVRVAEAGQDEAIVPLPSGGGAVSPSIEININTGVGDPVEIGRQVVSALQSYQRRAGSIPIKVK